MQPSKNITIREARNEVPYHTPEWAKHVIWYQIFPERFRNGDLSNDPTSDRLEDEVPEGWEITPWTGDWYRQAEWEQKLGEQFRDGVFNRRYGGDLQGILEKLDYLEELGVGGLYLNPVFDGLSLHKYDTSYYHHVDRFFGPDPTGDAAIMARENPADPSTWEWTAADRIFLKLIEEVHSRGMKIIIDGVFNHSGKDFWAFRDLIERQLESPYKEWYDIISFRNGEGGQFDYHSWWGVKSLPEFKAIDQSLAEPVCEHIYQITRRWMDPDGDGDPSDGIDGWRLDVPEEVGQNFWVDWHKLVREINPEAFTVGEIWTENAIHYVNEEQFNTVMNYRFMEAVQDYMVDRDITIAEFSDRLDRIRSSYPKEANYVMQNLMESHDTPRLASIIVNPGRKFDNWGRPEDGFDVRKPDVTERAVQRLIALLQYTYVGAPMIYYGTEAGMWGANDPDDRKPMVWPDMEFEPETLHPVNGSERPEDPNGFDQELFNWYKKLGQIRNSHDALQTGLYKKLYSNNDLFVFARFFKGSDPVIVILNRSQEQQSLGLKLSQLISTPHSFKDLFSGKVLVVSLENSVNIVLGPLEGTIIAPQ